MNKKNYKNLNLLNNKRGSESVKLRKQMTRLEINYENSQAEIKGLKADLNKQASFIKLVQEKNCSQFKIIKKLQENLEKLGVKPDFDTEQINKSDLEHEEIVNTDSFLAKNNSETEINLEKIRQDLQKQINADYLTKIKEKAEQAEQILKQKIAEFQKKYDNQLIEVKKYAFEKEVVQLVEIIYQFENVLKQTPDDPALKNYLFGFNMFLSMFEQLLSDLSISKIDVAHGVEFDPQIMEAFESEITNDKNLINKVISMITPGYKLHDRVIKHAMVKVGVSE